MHKIDEFLSEVSTSDAINLVNVFKSRDKINEIYGFGNKKKRVSNIFNGSNELCLCAFDGRCYIFIPITEPIALSYLGRFSLHLALDRAILITVKHSETHIKIDFRHK